MIITIVLCIIIILELLVIKNLNSNKKMVVPQVQPKSLVQTLMAKPNSCELCYRMNDEMEEMCKQKYDRTSPNFSNNGSFDQCELNRKITYQNCLNQCN